MTQPASLSPSSLTQSPYFSYPPSPSRESLRQDVLATFSAQKTVLPRTYPPVGFHSGTLIFQPEEGIEERVASLAEKLSTYCKKYGFTLAPSPAANDFSYHFFDGAAPAHQVLLKRVRTLFPELAPLSLLQSHGYGTSFRDGDILEVCPTVMEGKSNGVPISYSEWNNPIVLQQAARGCTAAASAMLILERGKTVSLDMLNQRSITSLDTMITDIRKAGLTPQKIECQTLDQLNQAIEANGSAIVNVNSGINGHVVVVDKILEEGVLLRDSYHGWQIIVEKNAFESAWTAAFVLQIV